MTLTKMYPRKLEPVERALFYAIQEERALGLPLNDSRVKDMAYFLYIELIPRMVMDALPLDFKFSDSWLKKFKDPYQLTMKTGRGEAGSVNMEEHKEAFDAIADRLSAYAPRDIYNCDETGLYLKVMSNRTLSQGRVKGTKPVTDARVSILLCSNADGTDKRKPFVLSSSCPRDLDPDVKAKLDTSFGGSGYMTTELFTTWLLAFDAAMDGRQIALLMDNAPGHGKEGGVEQQLRNIRLIRLPKNTTSVSQPLDAGIIMSFKVKNSRLMIPVMSYYYHERKLHDEREKLKEPGERKRFNFPKAPLWACLPDAWDQVSLSTIRNCYATVPVIPKAMSDALKLTAKEKQDNNEIDKLREELAEVYPDRIDLIGKQDDYAVLVFLKSLKRRGPTVQMDKFISAVATEDRYKHLFLPEDERLNVVQEESDDSDPEYLPPPSTVAPCLQEQVPWERIMYRRSGPQSMAVPLDDPSSPEPVSSQEIPSQETPPQDIPLQETLPQETHPAADLTDKSGLYKKKKLLPPPIPADYMMKELHEYSKTYRNHHCHLQEKEALYLTSLEERVVQNIDLMLDFLKLFAIRY